jgi:hypothetical protein
MEFRSLSFGEAVNSKTGNSTEAVFDVFVSPVKFIAIASCANTFPDTEEKIMTAKSNFVFMF